MPPAACRLLGKVTIHLCCRQCRELCINLHFRHNASQAAKAKRGNAISPSESPLDGSSSSSPSPSSSPFLARTRDNFIPAPRTSGACFSLGNYYTSITCDIFDVSFYHSQIP